MTIRAGLLLVAVLATACRSPKTPSSGGRTVAEHRQNFLEKCAAKQAGGPEYCDCAWVQFEAMFSEEEMNAKDVEPAKLEKYKSAVSTVCLNKVPEENLKAGYDKGCTSGRAEFIPYCDCTWTELRATFSARELADSTVVKSREFQEAKKAAVKTCSPHMPEGVVQQGFMKGCAKDPSLEKFCTCGWNELMKHVTPAQLQSDDYDQSEVFPKVEKVCGKLRPKKK